MRIFVASWFFPPSTSSEGNVTYKLLRNSRHEYVVCSSSSELWSYKKRSELQADNIVVYPIDTDSFDEWIDEGSELFNSLHAQQPFDAIMTRSMPPESILLAERILESNPGIPWIASLADAIAKSPYDYFNFIENDKYLKEREKKDFRVALENDYEGWRGHPNDNIRRLVKLREIEDFAINKADVLIFPCDTLRNFILGTRKRTNAYTIPHSYDLALFSHDEMFTSKDKVILTFLGHSDYNRSLNMLVEALSLIGETNAQVLNKLRIRIVGNTVEEFRVMVYNKFLHEVIRIESSVDYLESLKIMQESDWLIHVDAYFSDLEKTGGSIFFAAKLADYMGTDKPILALTGRGSPSDIIVKEAGGVSVKQDDLVGLSQVLSDIAISKCGVVVDRAFRDNFDAKSVSDQFDQLIEARLSGNPNPVIRRDHWPTPDKQYFDYQKLLTVCVPAFNVEAFLDRCLFSLVACECANLLDVIVVNDGSTDATLSVAQSFQEQYPSIIRIVNKTNGGHGSTINEALKLAKGIYFRVVDGDDWVDSNNLDKTLMKVLESGLDADLVSSNYHQVNSSSGDLIQWKKQSKREDYKAYDFSQADFGMEYFTMASAMVKTQLLRKADFKLQEHTYYVDVEYILFPIPYIKSVAFTPEYIYRYYVGNLDQSINHEQFVKRYDHHDRVIKRMVKFYEEKRPDLSVGQEQYIKSLMVKHFLRSQFEISAVLDPDYVRGSQRAKEFNSFLKENSKILYKALRKRYSSIRRMQRSGFSVGSIKRTRWIAREPFRLRVANKLRQVQYSSIGKKLASNSLARKIYNKLKA